MKADGTRKFGSTIWQARWRPRDDSSDLDREERNFKTKREAQDWMDQRDDDVRHGNYAPARKGAERFETILDEVRAKWDLALEPKTRAGYESILDRWITGEEDPLNPGRPCRFREAKLAAITTKMVQEFVNEVWGVRSPNTTRRIFGVLKAVTSQAVLSGYISNNPCTDVQLPSKKRAGVRRSHLYLEGPELRKLAEAMPEHWRLPVYVAGSCGLRAGELWALRRRDVDLLHDELTVRYALKEVHSKAEALESTKGLLVGPPKSAASRRRLSIASGIAAMLKVAIESPGTRSTHGYAVARAVDEDHGELDWTNDANDPDRLLFVTENGYPVRHNLFYKRIFRPVVVGDPDNEDPELRREPALPKRLHAFRWHDLRHTAATLTLVESGGDLGLVKERLGHENVSTTIDLYGKRVASRDAKVADLVGASIFADEEKVVPIKLSRP